MSKPILNKPYTRSESTDIRETFELERCRLALAQTCQADIEFGKRLGQAQLNLARPMQREAQIDA